MAGGFEEGISGLDIPMYEAELMRVIPGGTDLLHDGEFLLP